LFDKRLPELREMKTERLTVPANDQLVAFVEAMTDPEDAAMTIEKLVGVCLVLIPHSIAACTYPRNGSSDITDMPLVSILDFILQEEFKDWHEGERLILSVI
jgi:hypothetical protein